jgi:hypothetical protein
MVPMTEVEDAAGTSRHIYPSSAMVGDYLRAAAGLVPTGVLFATVPIGAAAGAVLGGFAAIFGVFALRTVLRHGTSVEMSDGELRAHGASHRIIRWDELDQMKLAYYSTRRDRRAGWMQLQLGAAGVKVTIDSRIAGFEEVVRRAAAAAWSRGVDLNEATVGNLEALGVKPRGAEWSR